MDALARLAGKKKKSVVGLMSGTSADGIDAVLVEIKGNGKRTRIRQLAFQTYPYPKGYKQFLLKNSIALTARLDDVTRLNMLVARFFADSTKNIVRKAGRQLHDIDLIGSHGQTIHHLPVTAKLFGKNVRATLQIGDPAVIAKLTGVVTVGDFRTGDVAVGGTGAPLVPYFDYIMLRSRTKHRAALNLGGIANITILPKNCSLTEVAAFDTGPGNMAVDGLMQRFYHRPFDAGGTVACGGRILPRLLHWMTRHSYLRVRPPKSTGREIFGEQFITNIVQRSRGERKQDIITSVTEFTALSIYLQYLSYIRKTTRIDELFVSGGGVHNSYLMDALQRYFGEARVILSDATDLSSDAKEALCFAVLANETISGNASNVPGATGARRSTILGKICLP